MRFSDMLRTAFLNLWRRKLRAFLTVLGMVIGTSSIVVMVSLGIGMREAMIESYAEMGSMTNITVTRWSYSMDENGNYSSSEKDLDKKTVEDFKRIPGVEAVMPRITAWGLLKSGRYVADIGIMGIDTSVADRFDIALQEGTFPSARTTGGTYDMVFASDLFAYSYFYDPNTGKPAEDRDGNPKVTPDSRFQLTFDYNNIYGGGSGMEGYSPGKFYRINGTGVTAGTGNQFSYYCLMDIEALKKLAKENSSFMNIDTSSYNEVIVKCTDTEAVESVNNYIKDLGYGTECLQEWIEQSEESIATTQYLLGAIGGVSLLVAAIGIMNTMMMSIYERTREIGIIKVLGCRISNIAALFLTESAYIGFFGGALGLGVSYTLSILLNRFLAGSGLYSSIPLYLALGAVAFSILVAVLSGLYPAFRAMRLSPLAAIRNE